MDCVICCESTTLVAEYSCRHKICYKCAARLVFKYNSKICPLCKEKSAKPLVFKRDDSIPGEELNKTIQNLKISSNENETEPSNIPGKESKIKKSNAKCTDIKKCEEDAAYDSTDVKCEVNALLENRCKLCSTVCKTQDKMFHHYKIEHNKLACKLCYEGAHLFWDEIGLYDFGQISQHNKGKLSEPGFTGHVFCIHCKSYQYNLDAAKRHCTAEHQLCTVCESLGKRFQFYKNYAELEEHYRSQHFCCTSSVCVKNLCYVFGYKSELWEHSHRYHGSNIKLDEITTGKTVNPPVCSLGGVEEPLPENIYQQSANIVTPIVNEPYFPSFTRPSTPGQVPEYLDRNILRQSESNESSRLKYVTIITKNFSNEICRVVGEFIDGSKTLQCMVQEIEEAVGNRICLQILQSVPFLQKQNEVNKYAVEYKKLVQFPVFKKTEKKLVEPKKTESYGFRIIDFRKNP
ncbi:E3 ubiquitin-protein ligase [Enteropsectra breve]|nr:E3 ubiquitin-protein ligase [Enteropsectra breve]